MPEQSYATHRQWVPAYHFVLFPLALVTFIGTLYNFYRAWGRESGRVEAILILLIAVCMMMAIYYLRIFALKAQDRIIRAEENARHMQLFGQPLDAALEVRQIIGLRFASDEEVGELAGKAVSEGLSEGAIKKSVKNWRGDYYRV